MPTIHEGVVTSIGKMVKTCTVTVSRQQEVPKILKSVTRSTKYLVHDEDHQTHIGDRVTIIDGLSYSLRKHFRIQSINRQGQDPSQYSSKPNEWKSLEARMKNAILKKQAVQEKRQKESDRREQVQLDYAEKVRRSGVAVDLDKDGGQAGASASASGGGRRAGEGTRQQGKGPGDEFGTKPPSA